MPSSDSMRQLDALRRATQLGTIDLRSQMRDLTQNYGMDTHEAERQFGRSRANLGQSMASRGLGWSGVKTGAQGRQLEDFTTAQGRSSLGYQQDKDALRRAIQQLRADAAIQEAEIMESQGLR